MKKILLIILILSLTTGCGLSVKNRGENTETIYQLNELVTIDHFNITAVNSNKEDGYLTVNFKIKNNAKNDVVVSSNDFRSYYNDEYVKPVSEFQETVLSNDEKMFSIIFKINEKDTKYKLLFYSNVVSNNVAFEVE